MKIQSTKEKILNLLKKSGKIALAKELEKFWKNHWHSEEKKGRMNLRTRYADSKTLRD